MEKPISKFHFIAGPHPVVSVEALVEELCKNGADWIQLRMKDLSDDYLLSLSYKVREITRRYGSKLIINDKPAIALKCEADGVHLGKKDMDPAEARMILGTTKIIGGTANTEEDVARLCKAGVDYIGAGPFRFTSTKKDLSPLLGAEGIARLARLSSVPVIAIGGIKASDVTSIIQEGPWGIAVSSAVSLAEDRVASLKEFLTEINKTIVHES